MRLKVYNPNEVLVERLKAFGEVISRGDHVLFVIEDKFCNIRYPNSKEKRKNKAVSHMVHLWCAKCEEQQHLKSIKHRDGVYLIF